MIENKLSKKKSEDYIVRWGQREREIEKNEQSRAAHGRVAPEGVNEKMLTIRSHQHQPQPRHEDGRRRAEFVGKVWKFCEWILQKSGIFSAASVTAADCVFNRLQCRIASVAGAWRANTGRQFIKLALM